jgi:hypothetical protein
MTLFENKDTKTFQLDPTGTGKGVAINLDEAKKNITDVLKNPSAIPSGVDPSIIYPPAYDSKNDAKQNQLQDLAQQLINVTRALNEGKQFLERTVDFAAKQPVQGNDYKAHNDMLEAVQKNSDNLMQQLNNEKQSLDSSTDTKDFQARLAALPALPAANDAKITFDAALLLAQRKQEEIAKNMGISAAQFNDIMRLLEMQDPHMWQQKNLAATSEKIHGMIARLASGEGIAINSLPVTHGGTTETPSLSISKDKVTGHQLIQASCWIGSNSFLWFLSRGKTIHAAIAVVRGLSACGHRKVAFYGGFNMPQRVAMMREALRLGTFDFAHFKDQGIAKDSRHRYDDPEIALLTKIFEIKQQHDIHYDPSKPYASEAKLFDAVHSDFKQRSGEMKAVVKAWTNAIGGEGLYKIYQGKMEGIARDDRANVDTKFRQQLRELDPTGGLNTELDRTITKHGQQWFSPPSESKEAKLEIKEEAHPAPSRT